MFLEYPIVSIEDPFDKEDWEHVKHFSSLGICQVCSAFHYFYIKSFGISTCQKKRKKEKRKKGISVEINLFYRRHKYCGVRSLIFEGDIDTYNNKIRFGY